PGKMHCIILWMGGGPSQLDTFDPKPGQANGGPFNAIDTSVKGIQISEHLPKLAQLAQHLAIIRSLEHPEGDHIRPTYLMHTGHSVNDPIPHPSLGAALGKELGDRSPLPRFVAISPKAPFHAEGRGPGLLGPRYGPLVVAAPEGGFRPGQPADSPRIP